MGSSLIKNNDPPYLQWREGTISSTCGMALGWKSAPKLLGLVAWGNQTSGLVGTCAKALPSKSWLCWNIIESSRSGIIFIYLLKSSPTWGGDKGVPVTQAELRNWKERKYSSPFLQAMRTTPNTSLFKQYWLKPDTPVQPSSTGEGKATQNNNI